MLNLPTIVHEISAALSGFRAASIRRADNPGLRDACVRKRRNDGDIRKQRPSVAPADRHLTVHLNAEFAVDTAARGPCQKADRPELNK
jgi:hypothetical protein